MVKYRIILILIFIFLFKEIENECNKENPIQTVNGCENIYCDETQFQNGDCTISNSIMKKQWLNNIIKFEGVNYILVMEKPNNDIIFAFFSYSEDPYCMGCFYFFLYELKSSGEQKYLSETMYFEFGFENINGVIVTIDNKHYPLLCSQVKCLLLDLENNYNKDIDYKELIGDNISIYSYKLISMINLDNKSKIFVTHITDEKLYLSINNIININLSFDNIYKANESAITQRIYEYIIKCFITKNNYIICLYMGNSAFVSSNVYYYIAIYDFSLNFLDNQKLDSSIINMSGVLFDNGVDAIHLKNEIGVFAYYLNDGRSGFSPLRIKIKELYFEESNPHLKNVISEEVIEVRLDDYEYEASGETGESLKKINDNQFCYSLIYSNDYILLILFDLYGTNNDNLLLRYYKINTKLYNLRLYDQLVLFKYNSFLGITFIHNYDFSSFIIFGYSSKITNKISLDIYNQNQGFIFEVKKYISIDNNLFGHDLSIKITSISNGIRIFSINDDKEIYINDLINEEDNILFDLYGIKKIIGEKHTIVFTWTISTPEYNKLSDYYDKIENYGEEDFNNFYESKILDQKTFTIEFKFVCFESSIRECKYPSLTTKTIQSDLYNIVYLSNFVYKVETSNLLKTYLAVNRYNQNDYCNNKEININQYNFMNECIIF